MSVIFIISEVLLRKPHEGVFSSTLLRTRLEAFTCTIIE